MASCSPTDLLAASSCFACLPTGQLQAVMAVLLCRILQAANPVASCDPKSLLQSASCFSCLPSGQLQIIMVQLLCEILQAGGSGTSACLLCTDGTGKQAGYIPSEVPTCDCALIYDYGHGSPDVGSLWYWDPVLHTWIPLIGGG